MSKKHELNIVEKTYEREPVLMEVENRKTKEKSMKIRYVRKLTGVKEYTEGFLSIYNLEARMAELRLDTQGEELTEYKFKVKKI